ncbi:hypothetical protein OF377_00865 [Ureaplasma sp. ES3154-GEN]|uniref:hypothetical protein n=1 Tax=Ureaplasma sp. ES3154-GEN TaxID=2984844 RepID=UPI0021E8042C|nr:hypothetical protein [Ureaplasma sp. ES3154-GEN]MCV3743439.1 hypothetical protein [Ureaplasma sp. ES3154-GEN]
MKLSKKAKIILIAGTIVGLGSVFAIYGVSKAKEDATAREELKKEGNNPDNKNQEGNSDDNNTNEK